MRRDAYLSRRAAATWPGAWVTEHEGRWDLRFPGPRLPEGFRGLVVALHNPETDPPGRGPRGAFHAARRMLRVLAGAEKLRRERAAP